MKLPPPTELQEQILVVEYLELLMMQGKIVLYGALPNNTYTKSWGQKMKQKQEGVKKGFPDLVVITSTKVLFLEMKRQRLGTVSPEQKQWLMNLKDKKTVSTVAKGFDEAKSWLDEQIRDV